MMGTADNYAIDPMSGKLVELGPRLSEIRLKADHTANALAEMVPFVPYDDLFAPEPDAKVSVPSLGLAAGPVNGLVGQGYVGKTIVAISMGLAVASGKRVWGVHDVQQGRWLYPDYEQGIRHTKSRVVRVMNGMGLDKDEMRGRFEVAVYPKLNLLHDNAEEYFARLLDGFAIATIDAFRGLVPGVDENATQTRDYIDRLGRAAEKTGCTVVLLHHAGKTPVQGSRPRKEMARGASGIFDAMQSMFVLTGEKGDPIHVSHEKDRELGHTVDDFGLRIVDVAREGDPKWGLRVEHLEKEQLRSAKKVGDALAPLKAEILALVRTTPGLKSKNSICLRVKGDKGRKLGAIGELIEEGQLLQLGGEKGEFRVP